jgi:hypothetical protein
VYHIINKDHIAISAMLPLLVIRLTERLSCTNMALSSAPGLSHPYHNFTGKLKISADIRHKDMLIAQVLDYFR